MPLFITVAEIQGRTFSKWSKIGFFRTFWPTLWKPLGPPGWLNARMCAGLCPTYATALDDAYVPLPAVGSSGRWGAGGGGVTISKNAGWSHYSRSAQAILQGGPKSSKKFRIFHHFQTLRPYISETVKNRGI